MPFAPAVTKHLCHSVEVEWISSKLRREGKQDVTRDAVLKSDVSRTGEHHAIRDAGPARTYGTALCGHSVTVLNSCKVSNSQIELPSTGETARKMPSIPPAKNTPQLR
jgi:hypothetical protein